MDGDTRAITATFLVLAVATTLVFVPTMNGHIASLNAGSIEATATDVALTDDGSVVRVEVSVTNPTRRPVVLRAAEFQAYAGDTRVAHTSVGAFDRTTVPAGETKTVTVRLAVEEGDRAAVRTAVENGTIRVSGLFRGTINEQYVDVDVERGAS